MLIFFFQAEDGIRAPLVTGVQTCALPISPTVTAVDERTGQQREVPAAQTVLVTGPEIAAADAQITAQVLLNLSTGLEKLVGIGALSVEAAKAAARKAWEDYVGVPYNADLDTPAANP